MSSRRKEIKRSHFPFCPSSHPCARLRSRVHRRSRLVTGSPKNPGHAAPLFLPPCRVLLRPASRPTLRVALRSFVAPLLSLYGWTPSRYLPIAHRHRGRPSDCDFAQVGAATLERSLAAQRPDPSGLSALRLSGKSANATDMADFRRAVARRRRAERRVPAPCAACPFPPVVAPCARGGNLGAARFPPDTPPNFYTRP